MWEKWRRGSSPEEGQSTIQLQHTLPHAAGKEVARTQADIRSTNLVCLAEGSLRKHKCHSPVQSVNLSFPGQDLKGTVACVTRQKKKKKQYCFGAAKEIHVFCLIRVSAFLFFPCTGKVLNNYTHPALCLHVLILILSKQLG